MGKRTRDSGETTMISLWSERIKCWRLVRLSLCKAFMIRKNSISSKEKMIAQISCCSYTKVTMLKNVGFLMLVERHGLL